VIVGQRTTASVRLTPGCALEPGRLRDPLCFRSPAVGVGHPDEEQTLAPVWGADIACAQDARGASVTHPFEVRDNAVQPARNERRNVFDDDNTRP
jgi:hypothetical protein